MATNQATLVHLNNIRAAINTAINNVSRYQSFSSEMTSVARTALLATVATVPSTLQHASDCAICTAWDGSVAE